MLEHPFRMPSIDEIERLLKLVKSSLTIQPRNAYEAQNNYTHNLERLEEAKKLLRSFSGDYVNGLQQQLIELDGQLTQAVAKASQPRGNDAFDLNFDAEGLENEVDEFERAEAELVATTADKKKKKQDKSTRVRSEKASRKAKEELEAKLAEEAVMNSVEPASLPCEEETTPPPASYVVLSNELKCKGTDIPALAVSRGRCGLVENSPLAYIILDEEVEWDGERCQCRVDLYRAVLYTLAQSKEPQPLEMKTSQVPSHDDLEEEDEEEDGAELGSGVTEHSPTQALSEQLVDEYDAAQAEAEERDAAGEFPVEIAPQVCARLRQFTTATWVILLCHGGYFAGGIFTNGVPVVHKSMQRYVVRKKQGGKQSSHAKDGGGSYSSAGSLIRASQELKWKIDVRDILRAWTPYIEAAQFILFAAPGPQNRSVLTDFSQLPASTDGPRTPSPILLKDPRVRRVPLTTHRPSFEEVQRIYGTVSTCSISYVREVPQCG